MTLTGVNGVDIPTSDFTPATALPMSFNGGKVALTNTAVSLTGTCPSDPAIVDFVGFGNSLSCFEGHAGAPAPSQTLAIYRLDDGCFDSDQNGSNFVTGAPSPRNSTSPTHTCGPFADVGIAVAGGTCPLSLGGTESFVVTVTNHGTATTDSVAVFQIPTNMSFVSSLPSTIPVGNIVTTAFAGMIAGESRTLTIDLTTSGTGGSPTTLATATSSLSDAGHPTAVSPSTTSCTISHASTPAARQSIERAGEDP